MGYNENQYSLPRIEDLSISRQSVYDDTYLHIPTVGWMFVPLVVYHSGQSAPSAGCSCRGSSTTQVSLHCRLDVRTTCRLPLRSVYTVGWMFMPRVVYRSGQSTPLCQLHDCPAFHGRHASGGKAAMFEPLSEHLREYEWALAQYLGAGVAACYRGHR